MAKGGWSMPLTALIPQVENEFVQLRNRIVAEALQGLHFHSPVDQGTYRSNHRVSVGDRDDTYDLSGGSRSPRGSVDDDAYQREMRKLLIENAPYTIIYIQNCLPYAQALEDGHSKKQAAEGVYRVVASLIRSKYGGG